MSYVTRGTKAQTPMTAMADVACPHCKAPMTPVKIKPGVFGLVCECLGYRAEDNPDDGTPPPWPIDNKDDD